MSVFHSHIRIRVRKEDFHGDGSFGRGVADLLYGVKNYHSLNLAAKDMGMAYSKAWKIIRLAEDALGIELLYRLGKNGSELTSDAEQFLRVYEEAQSEASKAVYKVFEKYYGESSQ